MANAYPSIEEWDEWSSGTSSIWTASVQGGAPTKLRDHARACAVSPDGTRISFATNKGTYAEREIWFMGPGGEQAQRFYEAREGTGIDCWGWSPDGKYYGYILADKSGDRIFSQAIEGGSPVELFGPSETKKMNDIVWLHDGRVVYVLPESESSIPTTTHIPSPHGDDYNVCNYWVMRLDPRTGKRTQEPRRLTNWPNLCVASGTVTDDDKRLSFAGWSGFFTTYVAALDAKGTRTRDVRHFTFSDSNDYVLDWTHDSKTIFIAQHRGDNWGLYKQSWDSETPEQIISPGRRGWLSLGVISPDGKWVIGGVWKGSDDGSSLTHMSLLRIPLYGGVPEIILETPRPAQLSCARPPSMGCVIAEETDDDKQLVVSSFDQMTGRGPELARFDLVQQNLIVAIDPEGSRLAIARSPEGSLEILSLRSKINYKVPSPRLGSIMALSWAADRSGFFLTRKAEDGTELLHVDRRGRVVSMRRCLGQACSGFPSPDGRLWRSLKGNRP